MFGRYVFGGHASRTSYAMSESAISPLCGFERGFFGVVGDGAAGSERDGERELLKARDGRRETPARVLKDRRSPRERGRMGTSRVYPSAFAASSSDEGDLRTHPKAAAGGARDAWSTPTTPSRMEDKTSRRVLAGRDDDDDDDDARAGARASSEDDDDDDDGR